MKMKTEQNDLFDSRMVRTNDHATSIAAAESLVENLSKLQEEVRLAIATFGPMNDETLERLPQFANRFGSTTISKRRTDLFNKNIVIQIGVNKNARGRKMFVWGLRGVHDHLRDRFDQE
jgi:hypothetical protein